MKCSVRQLLADFGADELTEWAAYDRISPFGSKRADKQAAAICLTVYSMLKAKTAPERALKDFELAFAASELPTPEELAAKLMGLTAAAGGEVICGEHREAGAGGDG